ncbi:hypothetical protein [uncultured Ruminococcus sp.]|uniref:hypothetical protein n=1 Tax=uncultured Ruminococcus sp. TaxID=165186 RepID=UPI0025D1B1E4|nr:hypothetical protein [uncultured Ruminococcus sp.]
MRLKRILGMVSAVMMLGVCAVPAYADSEADIPEYSADKSILTTDTSAPSISFDMKDWERYIHVTPDGEKISIGVSQEKTYAYQGASLKITATQPNDISDFCTYSALIRDENNELVYPGSDAEDAQYLTMGVELEAKDYGMSCFDGCMISFKYRINQDAQGKLLGDSVFAFPCTDEYKTVTSNSVQLKINTDASNNVTQYATALIPVPDKCGATKFVFEIPVIKKMDKTDVLYIDNIVIDTPLQQNGTDLQVMNLDGYNKSAKAQEIVQGLKIQPKSNGLSSTSTSEADSSRGIGVIGIVVIVVVVVVVLGAVILVIKKKRSRFY